MQILSKGKFSTPSFLKSVPNNSICNSYHIISKYIFHCIIDSHIFCLEFNLQILRDSGTFVLFFLSTFMYRKFKLFYINLAYGCKKYFLKKECACVHNQQIRHHFIVIRTDNFSNSLAKLNIFLKIYKIINSKGKDFQEDEH